MRILLAEDDLNLNRSLAERLREHGCEIDACYDGEEALYLALEGIHDVILPDRLMPHLDGASVVKQLRAQGVSVPVIMITALGTVQDRVEGLTLGADDYLVKPFAFEELLARIACVTRRSPILHMNPSLSVGDISYDTTNLVLAGPVSSVTLSRREGTLISFFLNHPNQTLSRTALLLKVWGPESDVEDGNLDNYIHFLRRRLAGVGSALELKCVRGVGYLLYVS